MRGPRALALLLPLLAAIPLSGCFVLEEIDAGMEIMEAHTPTDRKKQKEQEQARASQGEKPPTYQEAVEGWWKDAKSLSRAPGDAEADDPMVPCSHAGRQVFTRRSDCIARGGEPG